MKMTMKVENKVVGEYKRGERKEGAGHKEADESEAEIRGK